ncbi:MAG TPA: hypothetical protein ENH06_01100 [bacterium]|nr:hypothetical protein [bacterium]
MFKKFFKFLNKSSKGISLYLAIILMSLLLAIALGISTILFTEINIIRAMGNSVIAFYAADTGIEQVLKDRGSPFSISNTFLDNGAYYYVDVTVSGPSCSAVNYCIKSAGIYNGVRRAIEIEY